MARRCPSGDSAIARAAWSAIGARAARGGVEEIDALGGEARKKFPVGREGYVHGADEAGRRRAAEPVDARAGAQIPDLGAAGRRIGLRRRINDEREPAAVGRERDLVGARQLDGNQLAGRHAEEARLVAAGEHQELAVARRRRGRVHVERPLVEQQRPRARGVCADDLHALPIDQHQLLVGEEDGELEIALLEREAAQLPPALHLPQPREVAAPGTQQPPARRQRRALEAVAGAELLHQPRPFARARGGDKK